MVRRQRTTKKATDSTATIENEVQKQSNTQDQKKKMAHTEARIQHADVEEHNGNACQTVCVHRLYYDTIIS